MKRTANKIVSEDFFKLETKPNQMLLNYYKIAKCIIKFVPNLIKFNLYKCGEAYMSNYNESAQRSERVDQKKTQKNFFKRISQMLNWTAD